MCVVVGGGVVVQQQEVARIAEIAQPFAVGTASTDNLTGSRKLLFVVFPVVCFLLFITITHSCSNDQLFSFCHRYWLFLAFFILFIQQLLVTNAATKVIGLSAPWYLEINMKGISNTAKRMVMGR